MAHVQTSMSLFDLSFQYQESCGGLLFDIDSVKQGYVYKAVKDNAAWHALPGIVNKMPNPCPSGWAGPMSLVYDETMTKYIMKRAWGKSLFE